MSIETKMNEGTSSLLVHLSVRVSSRTAILKAVKALYFEVKGHHLPYSKETVLKRLTLDDFITFKVPGVYIIVLNLGKNNC